MPLGQLPLEISLKILAYLTANDKNRLCRTHKALYELCNGELYREEIRTQSFASVGSSCVLWAAYYGSIGTLKNAVRYGANITGPSRQLANKHGIKIFRTRDIYTTLYLAVVADEYAMIQYLLENGVDMHTPFFNSRTSVRIEPFVYDNESHSSLTSDDEESPNGSDDELDHVSEDLAQFWHPRRFSAQVSESLEFPLLEALRRVKTDRNIQAAELLISHGAYLIKPGVTALDFYSDFVASDSKLDGSEFILKLLAKTPKKEASGGWVLQNRGASQTDDDKALLLRLLRC